MHTFLLKLNMLGFFLLSMLDGLTGTTTSTFIILNIMRKIMSEDLFDEQFSTDAFGFA